MLERLDWWFRFWDILVLIHKMVYKPFPGGSHFLLKGMDDAPARLALKNQVRDSI